MILHQNPPSRSHSMLKPGAGCLLLLLGALSGLTAAEPAAPLPKAYDWPQWQGPQRTAISRETGLLSSWPKEGPPLLWKANNLGGGYSTPSVVAGRVFGMSFRETDEIVWALAE